MKNCAISVLIYKNILPMFFWILFCSKYIMILIKWKVHHSVVFYNIYFILRLAIEKNYLLFSCISKE